MGRLISLDKLWLFSQRLGLPDLNPPVQADCEDVTSQAAGEREFLDGGQTLQTPRQRWLC